MGAVEWLQGAASTIQRTVQNIVQPRPAAQSPSPTVTLPAPYIAGRPSTGATVTVERPVTTPYVPPVSRPSVGTAISGAELTGKFIYSPTDTLAQNIQTMGITAAQVPSYVAAGKIQGLTFDPAKGIVTSEGKWAGLPMQIRITETGETRGYPGLAVSATKAQIQQEIAAYAKPKLLADTTTVFMPYGSYKQTAIEDAKLKIDPLTGEVGVYQKPYGRSQYMLVGGAGRYGLQSGTISVGKPLTPAVYTQESGGKILSREYADVTAASKVLEEPTKYSRLGAEAYGGYVTPLDARTLTATTQMGRYASPYNLANLAIEGSANVGKAAAPGAAIPWEIPATAPAISTFAGREITMPALEAAAITPAKEAVDVGTLGLPAPFVSAKAPKTTGTMGVFGLTALLGTEEKAKPTVTTPSTFEQELVAGLKPGFAGGLVGRTLFGEKAGEVTRGFVGSVSDFTTGIVGFAPFKERMQVVSPELTEFREKKAEMEKTATPEEYNKFLQESYQKGVLEITPAGKYIEAPSKTFEYGEYSKWGVGVGEAIRGKLGFTLPQLEQYGYQLEQKKGIETIPEKLVYGAEYTLATRPEKALTAAGAGALWLTGGAAIRGAAEAGGLAARYGTFTAARPLAAKSIETTVKIGVPAVLAGATLYGASEGFTATPERTTIALGEMIPEFGGLVAGGGVARAGLRGIETGYLGYGTREYKPGEYKTSITKPVEAAEVPTALAGREIIRQPKFTGEILPTKLLEPSVIPERTTRFVSRRTRFEETPYKVVDITKATGKPIELARPDITERPATPEIFVPKEFKVSVKEATFTTPKTITFGEAPKIRISEPALPRAQRTITIEKPKEPSTIPTIDIERAVRIKERAEYKKPRTAFTEAEVGISKRVKTKAYKRYLLKTEGIIKTGLPKEGMVQLKPTRETFEKRLSKTPFEPSRETLEKFRSISRVVDSGEKPVVAVGLKGYLEEMRQAQAQAEIPAVISPRATEIGISTATITATTPATADIVKAAQVSKATPITETAKATKEETKQFEKYIPATTPKLRTIPEVTSTTRTGVREIPTPKEKEVKKPYVPYEGYRYKPITEKPTPEKPVTRKPYIPYEEPPYKPTPEKPVKPIIPIIPVFPSLPSGGTPSPLMRKGPGRRYVELLGLEYARRRSPFAAKKTTKKSAKRKQKI